MLANQPAVQIISLTADYPLLDPTWTALPLLNLASPFALLFAVVQVFRQKFSLLYIKLVAGLALQLQPLSQCTDLSH